MKQSCSPQCSHRYRGCPLLPRRECRCCPGFVVVFNEPKELCLIGEISAEMKPHTLRIVMLQAVIEPLVITEVEPLLLQLPLEAPVSLGDKEKFRIRSLDGRNKLTPVFRCRPLSRAVAPGAFEDRVQEQHRHVA